jgi:ethylbenzene hydroxylase subunit gamma/complex iron-sulfur molybdoenzyme family reductase subunit gamma
MKAHRLRGDSQDLADLGGRFWGSAPSTTVELAPAPLVRVALVSPQMSTRDDHGSVRSLQVQAAHDGAQLAFRLVWRMLEPHTIGDLDQFADAVAIMFPMHPEASAITMGAKNRPVNAWYWRAGNAGPFDVYAEGLGTSLRRDAAETGLAARSRHVDGEWTVVLMRPLAVAAEAVLFEPGLRSSVAFSVWDGGNAERAAYKSSSLVFSDFELEA